MRRKRFGMVALVCLVGSLFISGWLPDPVRGQPVAGRVYLPLVTRSYSPGLVVTPYGYGMGSALTGTSGLVQSAGFGWVKYQLIWNDSERQQGQYDWLDSDSHANNIVSAAERAGVKLLLRVDTPPDWANGGAGPQTPPSNPDDYGRFLRALATAFRGRIHAYEIWNEPNLAWEWGNRSPSPAEYTALLKAAYNGIKAGDPGAMVVTAGLASTGGAGDAAMNDVDFIRGMYDSGARGYFDALGSHPYGFSSAPEYLWGANINFFRRAEAQRQVMLDYGDAGRQVWATEFGWLLNPADFGASCPGWPGRDWQMVPPQTQANYLVRAYDYAYDNWPWMGPMFLFNLDFSVAPWYDECNVMRWYSVVNQNQSPRPAYTALQNMAKPVR
ncbi:MAG: cellulase family glycosylhydrolase [Chloroflexota bacterium]